MRAMQFLKALMLIPVLSIISLPAAAHHFWLMPDGENHTLVYGHGADWDSYKMDRIKEVSAYDRQGKTVPVQLESKQLKFTSPAGGALSEPVASFRSAGIGMADFVIDIGYWTAFEGGWANFPKTVFRNSKYAIHYLMYSKNLLSWSQSYAVATGAIMEIVPLNDPFDSSGKEIKVLVLHDGKPLKAHLVEIDGNAEEYMTDADGVARLPLMQGLHLIVTSQSETLADDSGAETRKHVASLSFHR